MTQSWENVQERGYWNLLLRGRCFFVVFDIHGSNNDILFEVEKKEGHKWQDGKEGKAQTGKDMVGSRRALRIDRKGTKHNQVLVGQNDQETQQKSNWETGWESFQNKGSQDTQSQVHQSRPDGSNEQCHRSVILLKIYHCSNASNWTQVIMRK